MRAFRGRLTAAMNVSLIRESEDDQSPASGNLARRVSKRHIACAELQAGSDQSTEPSPRSRPLTHRVSEMHSTGPQPYTLPTGPSAARQSTVSAGSRYAVSDVRPRTRRDT